MVIKGITIACAALALSAAAVAADPPRPSKSDWGGAVLLQPFRYMTDVDIPAGEHGAVVISFAIGTNGRASDCQIVQSSGLKRLDDTACKELPELMRFKPARDKNGKPIATRGTTSVRF